MPKLLDAIIAPPVILYFAIKRLVTGKPNTPLLYAAELLEKGLNTKIREVSIGTPEANNGNTYYFPDEDYKLTESDLKNASKLLKISPKYLRLVKWEDNRIVFAISNAGLLQLKNRIETFPNLWQKLKNRMRLGENPNLLQNLKNSKV